MIFHEIWIRAAGRDHGLIVGHRIARQLLRFKCANCRLKLNHQLRRLPHGLKMRFELFDGTRIADDDKIVVLLAFAARAEIRGACVHEHTVYREGLQVHERPTALDPDVVGKVAELDEVVALARVQDDPDYDATVISVVQRIDDDGVGKGVGGEVDRALGALDKRRVDCVESLLWREWIS